MAIGHDLDNIFFQTSKSNDNLMVNNLFVAINKYPKLNILPITPANNTHINPQSKYIAITTNKIIVDLPITSAILTLIIFNLF